MAPSGHPLPQTASVTASASPDPLYPSIVLKFLRMASSGGRRLTRVVNAFSRASSVLLPAIRVASDKALNSLLVRASDLRKFKASLQSVRSYVFKQMYVFQGEIKSERRVGVIALLYEPCILYLLVNLHLSGRTTDVTAPASMTEMRSGLWFDGPKFLLNKQQVRRLK